MFTVFAKVRKKSEIDKVDARQPTNSNNTTLKIISGALLPDFNDNNSTLWKQTSYWFLILPSYIEYFYSPYCSCHTFLFNIWESSHPSSPLLCWPSDCLPYFAPSCCQSCCNPSVGHCLEAEVVSYCLTERE